ncbi:hypothetical protein [Psychrobacter piechaudii]|uniref:Uncharacterized protein n=1 Tax=Psychrobacter piechaudii TaxID=1945521 RepID=A0A1R4GYB9_9GAMM|nr:hypothetical protein [Psychrobacter piechaudii]SJM73135.1 hypothetical protein A1232T_02341 [Psychrobacter piechaudii]
MGLKLLHTSLPKLGLIVQGKLESAEKEVFLDAHGWQLLDYSAKLSYKPTELTKSFVVDIEDRKVSSSFTDNEDTLNLNLANTEITQGEFIGWLDQEYHQSDVTQSDMIGFLAKIINNLLQNPKLTLTTLISNKYPLASATQALIQTYRKQASTQGYQETLFDNDSEVLTTYDYSYELKPVNYPARSPYYSGRHEFKKHYYPLIEDLKASG